MKKSVLSLALVLALVLAYAPVRAAESTAFGNVVQNNPVEQITGTVWQKTDDTDKAAFLLGVESAIAVEYFVNAKLTEKAAKNGKKPTCTLSPFEKGWMKAFKDVKRVEIIRMVDQWYAANPDKLDSPVMSVIWYQLIAPRLAAK
ncbi:MAG: hypothetical protein PHI96_10490 [Desulfovibrio sp.]|nr:hypothetical protein [Desulfovibrio sp.]